MKLMGGLMYRLIFLMILLLTAKLSCAEEELLTAPYSDTENGVPYVFNHIGMQPHYILILFPGGTGSVDPKMEDGKLVYKAKGNFLLRARQYFVDEEFATVATNSTQSSSRIQALLDDLKRRFPQAKIYLAGTSKGTYDTLELAAYLSDKIAGEIHTSSMKRISFLNPKDYKNRQLIVHHREDTCMVTPLSASQASHDRYGTELIVMEGGISVGDVCEAFAHHGYNGIEKETAEAIKNWVRQGE
jgi:hypothetical protein